MSAAQDRLLRAWDRHIASWLAGDDSLPDDLDAWWRSYRGRGRGEPTREAFAEPYIGDWTRARVLMLGLNPGPPDLRFQGREGTFARDIAGRGAYSDWAATDPYGSRDWEKEKGTNVYRRARLRFAEVWTDNPELAPEALLTVELYPWHSDRVTAMMKPPPEVLDTYVWRPLSELSSSTIFAFGAPWLRILGRSGLEPTDRWGKGGRDFGSPVRSRAFVTFDVPSRQRLVVSWQQGYAGPPGHDDTLRMREAIGR